MTPSKPVPDLFVEQLALDELPAERARQVAARLAAEPGGEDRLAELDSSSAAILADYQPGPQTARIRERAARGSRWRSHRRLLVVAVPLAAAASATFALLLGPQVVRVPTAPPEEVRLKGAPQLQVFRKQPSGVEQLQPGATIHAGDLLRIGYVANQAVHGVILSVDGRGAVTLHYPASPSGATVLATGGRQLLPFAYELDDSPGFERFFFVYSASPLDAEAVLASARRLPVNPDAKLGPPPGARVKSLLLLRSRHPER